MDFDFIIRFMLRWALITPWCLYFVGTVFGITCIWERGRKERAVISIMIFFFATIILGILVLPGSYRIVTDMMRAAYYFPGM